MRADGRLSHRGEDRLLWQRSRDADAAEDTAERFLDLAGFADGRLDPEDRARITELLARETEAAADVAAARSLGRGPLPAVSEPVLARAAALVPGDTAPGRIISFSSRRRPAPSLQRFAQWGSLAAAIAMAAWLGFALGADTSMSLTRAGVQNEDSVLPELLDPSTGFLRDLTEGART